MKQAMGEFDKIVSNINNNSIFFEVSYNLKEKIEVMKKTIPFFHII